MGRSAIEYEEKEKQHILLLSEDFKSEKLMGWEGFIAFMVILGKEIPVQAWTGPEGSKI